MLRNAVSGAARRPSKRHLRRPAPAAAAVSAWCWWWTTRASLSTRACSSPSPTPCWAGEPSSVGDCDTWACAAQDVRRAARRRAGAPERQGRVRRAGRHLGRLLPRPARLLPAGRDQLPAQRQRAGAARGVRLPARAVHGAHRALPEPARAAPRAQQRGRAPPVLALPRRARPAAHGRQHGGASAPPRIPRAVWCNSRALPWTARRARVPHRRAARRRRGRLGRRLPAADGRGRAPG